jgi:hypothetical protein
MKSIILLYETKELIIYKQLIKTNFIFISQLKMNKTSELSLKTIIKLLQ